MSKNLLIVESPAKAKTIEKYLGKDFKVKSSYGHICDLDKGDKGVVVDKDFELSYVVSPEKKKVVSELKKAVKEAEEVWLATDEDREGEAISWHLCNVLGLNEAETKRIVFREITQPAIKKAIENPRQVDLNLVDAQQARRVLDRLVGFELSELLWKKVKNKLSAGRVQSVAVKLVVEREREIQQFSVESFFKVSAEFTIEDDKTGSTVKATLDQRFDSEEQAMAFLEQSKGSQYSISEIKVKPAKKRPSPPFTTSTLQQEASRKMGFSVSRTMQVAQQLYEAGHITYMRTDSTQLSQTALHALAEAIEEEYGSKYVKTRQYASKKDLAQEAHEAIRPTYAGKNKISGSSEMVRLYDLIRKRTLASQMADAELERTTVRIAGSTIPEYTYTATGEVMKFDGFLKVYLEFIDKDEDQEESGILPPMKKGQAMIAGQIEATERFTRPPARYSEASLVKKLEELGIGRPSTYAPTISKITESSRNYVVKESRDGTTRKYRRLVLTNNDMATKTEEENTGAEKNKLFPTDLGMVVVDFLDQHFKDIMNYKFTANIEEEFDEVAAGKNSWKKLLRDFYFPFHQVVQKTLEQADRATGERILGKDPKSGRTLLVRMSRFGPVAQIGTPEELGKEKPQYASLQPGQSLETITFDEAMRLFVYPKTIGPYNDDVIIMNLGRFGPYLKYKELYVNIPRNVELRSINHETAVAMVKAKEEENMPVTTFRDKPVYRGKGRFGPFLKWGDLFVNIPRKFNPEQLKEEEMHQLIADKVEKESKKYIQAWEEENIQILNGRWGPYIKFGKENLKIDKLEDGNRMTTDQAAELSLDEVKKMIEKQIPDAFSGNKKSSASKVADGKKTARKRTGTTRTKSGTSTPLRKSIKTEPILRKKR